MEVFGNIEALKKSIEQKYSLKIREKEKQYKEELKEINKDLKEGLELLHSRMATLTNAEAKKAHSMILSSEKLKAKKEFEEKREYLIDSVFKEAEKKAKEVASTSDYIDYVKKNQPEEESALVKGGSDSYKRAFPQVQIDKTLTGLKFELQGIIYDFTLDNMISSKKDILRHEVSKTLFD